MHSLIPDELGARRPTASELGSNEPDWNERVAPQPSCATCPPEEVAALAHYRPELPTTVLIAEVRSLLISERRAGRLVCRYLADLVDRLEQQRDGDPLAHRDEVWAAASFFNLGAKETRERVRVGRALRGLPRIEATFVAGTLCYSRVREVTRVARADTEHFWLDLALDLDMRTLERRVSRVAKRAPLTSENVASEERASEPLDPEPFDWQPLDSEALDAPSLDAPSLDPDAHGVARDSRATEDEPGEPAPVPDRTEHHAPSVVRVTFELSSEELTLLGRALDAARRRARVPLADADALMAIARESLAAEGIGAEFQGDTSDATPRASSDGSDTHLLISNGRDAKRPPASPCDDSQSARPVRCEASSDPTSRDDSNDGHELAVQRATFAPPPGRPSSASSSESSLDALRVNPALPSALAPRSASTTTAGETTSQVGASRTRPIRLLDIIERRDRWSLEHLADVTGMTVPELQHALLLLELDGHIRRSSSWISPARAPSRSRKSLHFPPAPTSRRAPSSRAAPSRHPH